MTLSLYIFINFLFINSIFGGAENLILGSSNEELKVQNSPKQSYNKILDWRDFKIVSPVKDQGNCNSGWAFAAIGAIESQIALRDYYTNETMKDLSEQQLVDCDTSGSKCSGGNILNAWNYIVKNKGVQTESSYPYTSGTSLLPFLSFCKASANAKETLQPIVKGNIIEKNETMIEGAVFQYGPVAIMMDGSKLSTYKGGIYKCNGTVNINHGALIVGLGMSSTRVPYWIVKNSRGKAWGMEGYFYLERGIDACGLTSQAGYPTI